MKFLFSHLRSAGLLTLLLALLLARSAHAQFPGGFGGQQGGNTSSRSRSTTKQYPNNGVGDAVFSIDANRNLVIIADEDTSKYISQVVSNLDRPKPQVLIKVVFLEVTHSDSLDIGIEGAYNKNFGGPIGSGMVTNFAVISNAIVPTSITGGTQGGFTGNNLFGLTPVGAGSAAGLYQVLGQDYSVTLKAIAASGNAKVLSRPSIIARNNQPATITVGQSVPLINGTRIDNFGNTLSTFNYTSVGIILRVTPFITSDGLVEMIVSPETSELVADRSQWVQIATGTAGTVSAPLINSRTADTVVVTPNGQTVIIGGLLESSKAESESKIPFLGDIPLLGNLFKHKIKNGARTELLIFLTPHIIDAPGQVASMTATERERSDAAKGLTEQELNKFLDKIPEKVPDPETKSKRKRK